MDNIEYINTEKSYYTKPLRLTRKGLGYFEKIVLLNFYFCNDDDVSTTK